MGFQDMKRGLEKLKRQIAGQEKGEKAREIGPENALVRDFNAQLDRMPLNPRQRVATEAATRQQLAWCKPVSEQDQRINAAWRAAIDGMPGGLRTEVDARFAALKEAEATLSDKRKRLADLPNDGDEIWIQRRVQLTSAIEQLEDLVKERMAACIQVCRYVVPGQLDRVLVALLAAADQAVADAEIQETERLARSRAEIGRLGRDRDAIATVRAQANDPIQIERHIGKQVSPDPELARRAARKREEESRARLARALSNGRLH